MRHAESRLPYTALAVSVAFSLLVVGWGWLSLETLTADRLAVRLLWPLARLLVFITLGLVVGQVIEATGWTRRLAVVAAPLFRFSNLGDRCSAAFTTAFLSGVAANAMLLSFFKEEKITRRQLFLSNLMNQLPAFFLHLPTTFFIVIPLTGWAGVLYFLLTFVALVIRTVLVMFCGRMFCKADFISEEIADSAYQQGGHNRKNKRVIESVKKRLPGRLVRIAVYVVPIYTLVFIVNAMGGFDAARQWLARFVVTSVLPVESLSVVILSFAAEFTSGFAAAGALLEAGVLTIKQTVIALLAGNIVAFPIRALRHQLPRYMGIFSPAMGLQLLLLGQGLRVISLVVVGVIYYCVSGVST
ncbi:MAG: nucleoside recognition protein [Desulfosarcina sp.]|nr:nucleoside recognition protein [Desulfosarcina sp.]MBC2743981.1 nucleoside recognition protein [Desulfosarcina sp.]MBC2766890.1 nucleoside recognition protein [Desulfosarcina sp.]